MRPDYSEQGSMPESADLERIFYRPTKPLRFRALRRWLWQWVPTVVLIVLFQWVVKAAVEIAWRR